MALVSLSLRFCLNGHVKHIEASRSAVCLFRLGAQLASSTNMLLRKITCVNLPIINLITVFCYASVNLMCRCISDLMWLI